MKKLALSLAVLFAVGMVSCGGNKEKECDSTCDTTPVEEVAVVEEGVVVDSANDTVGAVEGAAVEAPAETPAAE